MTTRQDTLIATAKAMALPAVDWVADREPLGYLLGNRTWEELAALVIVLAEALGDEAGRERLAQVCAAEPGRGGSLWGCDTRWSNRDDGVVDDLAVALVAAGMSTPRRPVRLTPPERRRAVEQITAAGGTAYDVARLLHVSNKTAHALLAQAAGEPAGDAEDAGTVAA